MAPTKPSARKTQAMVSKESGNSSSLLRRVKCTLNSAKAKLGMSRITKLKSFPKGRLSSDPQLVQRIIESASNSEVSLPGSSVPLVKSTPKPPHPDLKVSDFEVGRGLGHGTFGRVFLAKHRPTSYVCALKVITKAKVASSVAERFIRREIEVHQNLAHPNILRLLNWFHDDKYICLVLEYAPGGNLFEEMHNQPRGYFREEVVAKYITQMAQALKYMHSKNIMHRDLKPENILLGLHSEIKLADFGYSVHSTSGVRSTLCGSLDYLPPEVAIMLFKPDQPREAYTRAVDQWSLGVLTYELLVGKPPFEMKSDKATQKKIVKFEGKLRFPGHVSLPAEQFVMELLNVDAEERMRLDEVLAHPWLMRHTERSVQAKLLRAI